MTADAIAGRLAAAAEASASGPTMLLRERRVCEHRKKKERCGDEDLGKL